jgi:hypothetical protein
VNFRVTLTVDYAASEPPDGYPAGIHTAVHPKELFGQLIAWSHAQGDSIVDCDIAHAGVIDGFDGQVLVEKPLMTVTVIYVVDASSEIAARRDTEAIFGESTLAFGLPKPKTVLAVAE